MKQAFGVPLVATPVQRCPRLEVYVHAAEERVYGVVARTLFL